MPLSFIKMNGAGNDFVIFDARQEPIRLTREQVVKIAARDNAITHGCDQVIVLEPAKHSASSIQHSEEKNNSLNAESRMLIPDVFMRIYNADGGEVDACGNATRCVAGILENELQRLPVVIETKAGLLQGLQKAYTPDEVEYLLVDMGAPRFGWQEIPLAMPVSEAVKKVETFSGLKSPSFVNMGNPHVVFFLDSEDALFAIDLEFTGHALEHYTEVFPKGINVSIALVKAAKDGQGHIAHARVWERGAGLTKACGTAACALLAAAHERDASVTKIHLWFEPEGYTVTVQLEENGHILLGGPIETEFEGSLTL